MAIGLRATDGHSVDLGFDSLAAILLFVLIQNITKPSKIMPN